jgi:hypothetical protein
MNDYPKDKLLPPRAFLHRFARSLAAGLALIAVSLAAGMIGYHTLAGLSWIDSFLDASMILSGMGPVATLTTTKAKLFAGCYAIYCGITLISTAGIILAPALHRSLHKFHLEWYGDK